MNSALIILNQLIKMALFCGIGYVLHRRKMISSEGCRAFSTLLLYVILPCVIVSSFFRENTPETTRFLLISFLVSLVLTVIALAISKLLFRKNPVDEFSSCFSNAGFLGMPLIAAAFGSEAVFYIAGYTALLNILQWTYGQRLLSDKETVSLRKLLSNPLVVALAAGVLIYFLPFDLPEQISSAVSAISACNGPVAMIILGYYLSEIPFADIFRLGYGVSAARLLLIPAACLAVLYFIPGIDILVKQVLLIAACAPVGINVAIYAQRLEKDYHRAVILICQSTVFCLLSMPALIWLSELIL